MGGTNERAKAVADRAFRRSRNTAGCLRMLDDLKNGRLRALIQPHRGQDVKEARAAYPTHYEVRIS